MIDYEASFVNTDGVAFPDTTAVNVSAPGAGDGTEFVKLMVDDIWGRAQAILDYAGMTPDGVSEAAGTAQILSALSRGYGIGPGIGVIYWKSGTPVANGDRVLLLQGQVILIATYPLLAAAVYVGNAANPTAPAFYKTSDAGGTTRDIAGAYLVLPDCRGLGLKMIGNATVLTRTKVGPVELGEKQEDQFQAWQAGSAADDSGAKPYWLNIRTRDTANSGVGGVNYGLLMASYDAVYRGSANRVKAVDDGTNGVPRVGVNTRDNSIGTNYGITY